MTVTLTPDCIGKQYCTRGGWRAVVVDYDPKDGLYCVWHSNDDAYQHDNFGKVSMHDRQYDLIAEYTQPRTVELKIAVDWENKYIRLIHAEQLGWSQPDVFINNPTIHTITLTEELS